MKGVSSSDLLVKQVVKKRMAVHRLIRKCRTDIRSGTPQRGVVHDDIVFTDDSRCDFAIRQHPITLRARNIASSPSDFKTIAETALTRRRIPRIRAFRWCRSIGSMLRVAYHVAVESFQQCLVAFVRDTRITFMPDGLASGLRLSR